MITSEVLNSHCEVLEALQRYFHTTAPAAAPITIEADTPLLGAGLLDSLSIVELTMFLSDEFTIEFSDDDFTADNFSTLGSLATLVASKREATG